MIASVTGVEKERRFRGRSVWGNHAPPIWSSLLFTTRGRNSKGYSAEERKLWEDGEKRSAHAGLKEKKEVEWQFGSTKP